MKVGRYTVTVDTVENELEVAVIIKGPVIAVPMQGPRVSKSCTCIGHRTDCFMMVL